MLNIKILLNCIWLRAFSSWINFNFISCTEYTQYPPPNHKLSWWRINLTTDWLLVQTKLCTDRTTTYQKMKNKSLGCPWLSKLGYCLKVYALDKTYQRITPSTKKSLVRLYCYSAYDTYKELAIGKKHAKESFIMFSLGVLQALKKYDLYDKKKIISTNLSYQKLLGIGLSICF